MHATQSPFLSTVADTGLPIAADAPESCVNCGRVLRGPYCTECGEQRASDRDNSFWGFTKEAAETFTTDRSFLASIKILISQPGELTAAYMRGRRVGLMRPLQLFLLINVAYFLLASATHLGLLTTTLQTHMHNTWHSQIATSLVEKRLGKTKVSEGLYEDRLLTYGKKFDAATAVQAKTLIFAMVPAFALLVGLIHVGRKRYVIEHLVFALHFYSAFLILVVLVALCFLVPMGLVDWVMHTRAINTPIIDQFLGLLSAGTLFWYLQRALRRAYGDGWLFATVGAAMLAAGMVLILFGYRALLFITTYWAT